MNPAYRRYLLIALVLAAAPVALAQWEYKNVSDKNRNEVTHIAYVRSDNAVRIGSSDGTQENRALLMLSKGIAGDAVELQIQGGRFRCGDRCYLSVRFGNESIRRFEAHGGNRPEEIRLFEHARFVQLARAHKEVVIEAEFVHDGARRFTFPLADLNW